MIFVIVLACLMVVSHQAVYKPHKSQLLLPHPYPFLRVPSDYKQQQRAAYLKGIYDAGRLGVNPSWQQNDDSVIVSTSDEHTDDEQYASFRSPIIDQGITNDIANETADEEDNLGRLWFGGATLGAAATANYFFKTSFVFTTSTVTLCSMYSCIPADNFMPGGVNLICRKKRDIDENLDDSSAYESIEPTNVEKVESTRIVTIDDPNFHPVPKGREVTVNVVPIVESSKEEQENSPLAFESARRNKRFLYLLTTTITTFKVFSTTYTTTLKPGTGNLLNCRPGGIAVC